MSPGKRSIEHKLPKVRRFVNAHILFKFSQFDVNFIKASCDKQWMMSAVLKTDDYLIYGNDNVGRRIKEKDSGIDLGLISFPDIDLVLKTVV
jgi:hypothetical protein